MEQKKKIRLAIIILAVLLGISATALGGTLVYRKIAHRDPGTVTVPDNLITPEEDTSGTDAVSLNESDSGNLNKEEEKTEPRTDDSADTTADDGLQTQAEAKTSSVPQRGGENQKKAATISLFTKQPQENTPFNSGNLFPGDSETKYFRVKVSYHDKITVHYKAVIRPGYEKLSDVMHMRVKLLTTGEVLYDGLMRDMPQSLTHKLVSSVSTTDELYYEITAYLDTSVGNEYQNRYLIADFSWWVEETGNLDVPKTGDNASVWLWTALAVVSCGALIFLLVSRRRKEEKKHG